mmetsp:Transcript_21924/g.35279  ORF Transcript_21924/g.35279 Transcript_21924/m.35279 type:complete len:154 (+) Transcript_21924:129-590(+)|eukprot:CAMPEP_0178753260 /NCGR_PEP_ID=MMETSP0744-20121128/11514_1 /TAXON_ID=913974 /ORGANISM="Nitzschia punctata, Strain CCMP561" /LENGTH=153 /DNA_ID=CAMNT_0020407059 /DNA_START=63 /DNA_END=524 /DNA_ORIENTATION=+
MGMSDDEIAEFKEVFDLFDYYSEGTIAEKDLGVAMRAWGITGVTQDGVKNLTDTYAEKGKINFEDFLEIMEKKMTDPGLSEDTVLDSFAVLDKEKNGKVAEKDLKHMLCKMGDFMESKEVDEVIKEFGNVDGDGMIDYKAFMNNINESCQIFS